VNFAFSRRGVEQNEVFLKRRRLRCHFAIQRQRDARTIEYQAVVAPTWFTYTIGSWWLSAIERSISTRSARLSMV